MLSPGQQFTLDIERPAAGGRMIARADGQVVLVDGVIPGERAVVRIDRTGKGVAYGHAVAIDVPSPDRRDPLTDRLCGGCLYGHIAYDRQRALKSLVIADALGRIGKIHWPQPIDVAPSPVEGYRMRARLHMRRQRIGFFREGTHDLCDARATRQLLPATSDALDRLAAALSDTLADAEIEVTENLDGSSRAVHVEPVPSTGGSNAARGASGNVMEQIGGVTGLIVAPSADARSRAPIIDAGDPHVSDLLPVDGGRFTLRRHVLSFFQGNRYLLRELVTRVLEHIAPNGDVVDLYAGAGLFAVASAVARGSRVTAVEGDASAAADLRVNAAQTVGAVSPVHQPVESFLAKARTAPSVLIVDPPRTGMSKVALEGAIRLRALRVIYVSCDVATLARDLARFAGAGYRITRIDAFDLFPNTPHVEAVVGLVRD